MSDREKIVGKAAKAEYKVEYAPITLDKDTVIRILDRHFAAYMRKTYENEPLSGANGEIVRIARLLCDIAGEIHALGEVKGTKSND